MVKKKTKQKDGGKFPKTVGVFYIYFIMEVSFFFVPGFWRTL